MLSRLAGGVSNRAGCGIIGAAPCRVRLHFLLAPGLTSYLHVPVVHPAALPAAFLCSIPQDLPMQSQRFIPGKDASLESSIAAQLLAQAGFPEPIDLEGHA